MENEKQYDITSVHQITGISKFTLRNWENRYSIFKVHKTASGRRVYSQKNINLLIAIKNLIDQGLSLNDAIKRYQLAKENLYSFYSLKVNTSIKKHEKNLKSPLETILQLLKESNLEVSRICLTRRIPNTNELVVIDSQDNLHTNSDYMAPYYRCFISKKSSLFSRSAESIRIYSSIGNIIKSYQDTPPQKSIDYIHRLGHESGLSLHCHGGQSLEGHVFFNSTEKNYFFDWNKTHKKILQSIRSIWIEHLVRNSVDTKEWDAKAAKYKGFSTPRAYAKSDIEDFLMTSSMCKYIKKNIFHYENFNHKFIYNPMALFSFLEQVFSKINIPVRLVISTKLSDTLRIDIESLAREKSIPYAELQDSDFLLELEYGLKFSKTKTKLTIFYPVEYNFEPKLGYSLYPN